jgi:hypothetical protein
MEPALDQSATCAASDARLRKASQLGFDAGKLTPAQEARVGMVAGLRLEADRLASAQVRRRSGRSGATAYGWRSLRGRLASCRG